MALAREYKIFNFRKNIFLRIACILICISLLASCSSKGTIKETIRMGEKDFLVTSADVRFILRDKPKSTGHVNEPSYITCAEPSPDIARAISSAFNTAFSGGATLPNGVTPEVAAAISKEHAETVAQMTERLSTIQLLRDGLYRACEAFANGAMSSTSYAVILSRFDDSMITLLQSELAAGAFGRSLATLSGKTSGEASSSLESSSLLKEHNESLSELTRSLKESSDLESSLKQARKENNELRRELDKVTDEVNRKRATMQLAEAEANDNSQAESLKTSELRKSHLETSIEQSSKAISSLESSHQSKKQNTRDLEKKLENKLAASVKGAAEAMAVSAGSITPGQQNIEIAKILHEMQDEYLNNLNMDALTVACISAMDKPDTDLTTLGKYCKTQDILGQGISVLGHIIDKRAEFKKLKLQQKMKIKSAPLAYPGDLSSLRPYRIQRTNFDISKQQDIRRLQNALNTVDNASIIEDGIYGKKTAAAIKRFQSTNNLTADGKANSDTMRKLFEKL